jgi:predicted dehydrogenase
MAYGEELRLKVLVVGSGPAGRRHLRNALALGHEAALVGRAGQPTDRLAAELEVPVFAGREDADGWRAEAVVAADPPAAHLATARWAVERGLPVLIEKPLAPGPEGVCELLDAATEEGLTVAVAYNLRFHPALVAIENAVSSGRIGRLLAVRAEVGSHLPDWHPEADYRVASAARRALGGGAALTLSHELDYVLWIAGEVVESSGFAVRVSDLELDTDDVAELVLRHASGTLSSVHVDLVDRTHRRASRWIGRNGTIEWSAGAPVTLSGDSEPETLWFEPGFDLSETYRSELESFLAGRPFPGDALADACRALKIIAALERR